MRNDLNLTNHANNWWRLWVCRRFGHDWSQQECNRKCLRCGREEALFENRFPKIGQPLYEWRLFPNIKRPWEKEEDHA